MGHAFEKLRFCNFLKNYLSDCFEILDQGGISKKLKNGELNKHIYYGCTKAKDKNCKCGYLNEAELIKQFKELIDKVDINETDIKKKIKGVRA